MTWRPNCFNSRYGNGTGTTPKDFTGDAPKIGCILGLVKISLEEINYDIFCETLGTYIMSKSKNGDAIFEVTKELIDEEKKDSVKLEIHKEEIKEYVNDLRILKSNLKKLYSLIDGNCTEIVQTILKVDEDYQ